VRDEVAAGRQAFVVCAAIDDGNRTQVKAAESEAVRLATEVFPDLRVELLHGRMRPKDKERIMDTFRSGESDLLISTTVIEVGVDVPNATVMVILDADRFGIAPLHQLRGRVGRGVHASSCWLVTQQIDGTSPRVDALVASTDGFELAEVDLDLRGEGTLMSTSQKGRSDLKLASLRRDRQLVELARHAAFEIVDSDPDLSGHQNLADELDLLVSDSDEEFLARN
jgi:ATP-dependent DNA helicase RecG